MIALVRENGKEYQTHIYAEYGKGTKLLMLIENEDKTKLKWIKYIGKNHKRQLYIFEKSPVAWIKKGKMTGESWVVENNQFTPSIFSKKEYEILPSYPLSNDTYTLKEINQIQTPYDIEVLESIAMGFNKAIIERVKREENNITLYVNTPWSLSLKLIFENAERYSKFDDLSIIEEAEINLRNGKIDLFVTEGLANNFQDPIADDDYFVIADSLSYKLYFN